MTAVVLWILWLLWALGCALMRDNIRAQQHDDYVNRGFVLGLIMIGWPIVVIYGLVMEIFEKEPTK